MKLSSVQKRNIESWDEFNHIVKWKIATIDIPKHISKGHFKVYLPKRITVAVGIDSYGKIHCTDINKSWGL